MAPQPLLTVFDAGRNQANRRYDNGVANSLDLLDAQRAQFAAQQSLIQVRLARLQSQVR